MKVGLVYGAWGQNIGNAFFNLGGKWLLEQVVGEENVKLVQDQPAYATFRNESKGNWPNAFDLISRLDIDLLVLQGPLFTPNFGNIWGPTFEIMKQRGVRWAGVGAAFRKYSTSEYAEVKQWIERYPPLFVSTRDQQSYKRLDSMDRRDFPINDGVDSAFFLPNAYRPADIDQSGGLVSLTFDHFPEPKLIEKDDGPIVVGNKNFDAISSATRTWMASKGKAGGIISHATFPRGPRILNGRTIVRPNHRTNPHLPQVIYRQPNGIGWDEPYTYLTLYNASELTLSDRVHACVATLTYGGEAMLFNPITKRSALFDRVGCGNITDRPVALEHDIVDEEIDKSKKFISNLL